MNNKLNMKTKRFKLTTQKDGHYEIIVYDFRLANKLWRELYGYSPRIDSEAEVTFNVEPEFLVKALKVLNVSEEYMKFRNII